MDGMQAYLNGTIKATDGPRGIQEGTIRRIAGFARPHQAKLVVFLLVTMVTAALSVVTPLLAGRVVDTVVSGGDAALVVWIAVAIAAHALVSAALRLVETWQSACIGEGLIYGLRRAVFEHVQRMPVAFFTRVRTGALVNRLNTDVLGAQRAFTSTLSGLVTNVIKLVVSLVVMMTQMTERFSAPGATLVRLFGRPRAEADEFGARAGRVRDIAVRIAILSRVFLSSLTLVSSLAQALVYGLGGYLAITGQLAPGTVVALVLLLTRLYTPLTALANVRVDVMTALVSFERVFEVLDLAPILEEKPGARSVPAGDVSVEFDDVRFGYPAASRVSLASLEEVAVLDQHDSEEVLHGISFRAEPGEMIALVGPSGAGKSTIASLVPRLYDVDSGAVRLNGVDVRDLSFDSLRETVGVVTQDGHMFHDTIRANLEYARPGASETELWNAIRRARLSGLVRSLPDRLDAVVGEHGYRLSGGERQRMTIARLLLAQPRLVILDEATAHLDSESEVAVQEALADALEGRTAIVIAHRLSTVRAADQILVVQDGMIVERGTHDTLLAAGGRYTGLYTTQFEPDWIEQAS